MSSLGQALVSGLDFLVIQNVGGPNPTRATAVSSEDSLHVLPTAMIQCAVRFTEGVQSQPFMGSSQQRYEFGV